MSPKKRSRQALASAPLLEAIEPRLLLSASPTLGALDSAWDIETAACGQVVAAGTLDSPDQGDVYSFTALADGRMTVEMGAAEDSGLDSSLEAYNARGRRIARNDNASRDTADSRLRLRVRAGRTYYLRASAADGTEGSYDLTITSDPKDDYGNTDQDARLLRLGRRGARANGRINYNSDVDYFSFLATQTGQVSVTMDGIGRSGVVGGSLAV